MVDFPFSIVTDTLLLPLEIQKCGDDDDEYIETKIIDPIDKTRSWKFPYVAPDDKISKIQDNKEKLGPEIIFSNVIELLGEPDIINVLQKGFCGLSPKEDGFLINNRKFLSYRAIWYLEKNSQIPNLKDKWITVYIANDGESVFHFLQNNIKP